MATFDTISLVPSAAVATNGTMTFTYPSGNASRYAKAGEKLNIKGLQVNSNAGASTFTLAYGASSVVVTYKGSTSIPAGTEVVIQLPLMDKVGVVTMPFFFNLAEIVGNADLLTNYVPGYAFKILSLDFQVVKAVTTGSKLASINMEIGTTDLTGGVVALTSALCTPAGVQVAGSVVSANNVGTATDSFSIEASGVTAFSEGSGYLLVKIQNLDTLNEFARRTQE